MLGNARLPRKTMEANKIFRTKGISFLHLKSMGRKRPTKYFPYKKYGLKSTHEVQCGGVVFKCRKNYITPKSKD